MIIFGFAFKENCNDIRNTKIFDLYNLLKKKYIVVDIYDPLVDKNEVQKNYNIKIKNHFKKNYYNTALIAVKHDIFKKIKKDDIENFLKGDKIVYDYIGLFK